MFQTILMLALKVLGCAIVVYLIAGCLVSLKKLLPFLALASSVGLFIAIYKIRGAGNEDLTWLLIALSIMTMFFYNGEGFMNPKVHENLFELVSVERKWNSIFEEFDEYEFHFRPFETGGFFENAIFSGILFWLYYEFLMPLSNNLVYILPVFIGIMSLIEILMVIGFRLSKGIYWIARVLVFVLTFTFTLVGNLGSKSKVSEDEKLFKDCMSIVDTAFSTSYEMDYTYYYKKNNSKDYSIMSGTEIGFIYDKELNVGADFVWRNNYSEKLYKKVYSGNQDIGEKFYQFNNFGSISEPDFRYFGEVDDVEGSFYSKAEIALHNIKPTINFMECYKITEDIFDGIWLIQRSFETLTVQYSSEFDENYNQENNTEYLVTWRFSMDEKKNPKSLLRIDLKVYPNSTNKEEWSYITKSETGLGDLFDENENLKGYTYNPNEICCVDLKEAFDSLSLSKGNIGNFNFSLYEDVDDVRNKYYYDKETKLTKYYENSQGSSTGDSLPDYYVSNSDYSKYDNEDRVIDSRNPSDFCAFTFDNAVASDVILNTFELDFALDGLDYFMYAGFLDVNGVIDYTMVFSYYNVNFDANVQYIATFTVEHQLNIVYLDSISGSVTYEGRDYQLFVYYS